MVFGFMRAREADVEPGRRYRPRVSGRVLETAHVVELSADRLGIPHVHYALTVGTPNVPAEWVGRRTLSLERFRALYPIPA